MIKENLLEILLNKTQGIESTQILSDFMKAGRDMQYCKNGLAAGITVMPSGRHVLERLIASCVHRAHMLKILSERTIETCE